MAGFRKQEAVTMRRLHDWSGRFQQAMLVAILCGSFLAAGAQEPELQIAGHVVEASTGAPLSGAKVWLRGTSPNSRAIPAITDAGGTFGFRRIPDGDYNLAAIMEGYVQEADGFDLKQPLKITSGTRLHGVELRLLRTAQGDAVPHAHATTSLDIEFTDEGGGKVTPATAELLLVTWGQTATLPLPLQKGSNHLQLPLDPDWLRTRWPANFGDQRSTDLEKVYLYFRADGFAPVRSEAFEWIGSGHSYAGHTVATAARIALPHGEKADIEEGKTGQLRVVFRKPQSRGLRIVDTAGKPIPGVAVQAGMFWSNTNHCAVPANENSLSRTTSDRDGRVAVPDGDFEYVLEFDKPHYLIESRNGGFFDNGTDPYLITRLDTAVTTITFRRLERKPLRLQVTAGGVPVAGLQIWGASAHCSCGACSGGLAVTDANGEIRVADFYPEEVGSLYIEDASGARIWQGEVRKLDITRPVRVALPR